MDRVENNWKMWVIDTSWKEIIPIKYDYIDTFYKWYAAIKKDWKYWTIDKLWNELFPFEDLLETPYFSEWMSNFSKNKKYWFIDITWKEIIPFIYDWVILRNEWIIEVTNDSKSGYIYWDWYIKWKN